MELYTKTVPIEVKYREDVRKRDLTGIYGFRERYQTSVNLVVTKNTMKMEDDILYVPLWLYLVVC